MTKPTPLDLLDASHISALMEVVRADSYVLGVRADEFESMSLLAVTLAMHRMASDLNRALLEGSLEDRISATRLVLRETSALLDVAPIAMCDAAPDLRLLERLSVLVLDELEGYNREHPNNEDPF